MMHFLLDNLNAIWYKEHMSDIHIILKEIVTKENVSVYRVAKDLGMDYGSVYRLLNERGNPTWSTIRKVLDYLGYEIRVAKVLPVKKGRTKKGG